MWTHVPAQEGPDDVHSGLSYLATLNQLLIKKKVEIFEAQTGVEVRNKYIIKNLIGESENVYYVVERINNCCTRTFGGSSSYIPPELKILDYYKNEVIQFRRKVECLSCFRFPWYRLTLEVYSTPGHLIGTVEKEETWAFCSLPTFNIKNEQGITTMKIKGPKPTCCRRVGNFQILSPDEKTEIAVLRRQWGTVMQEWRSQADFFHITFSVDLDVRSKATIIGACFLIGFVYYTNNNNR